jgi:hypothetical protein
LPAIFVQVKYATDSASAAPDGWVTVSAVDDLRKATRHAATVYRDATHPEDGQPTQLRLVTEGQLVDEGGQAAVREAYSSLRRHGARLAGAEVVLARAAGDRDARAHRHRA